MVEAEASVTRSHTHEADLVERAKAKSNEAWTEIYGENFAPIYRYVHARVFDHETAEDLTATVFMGAIKGIHSYNYRGQPFLAWLYRIARNVVSSHQRELFGRRGDGPSRMFRSIFGRSKGADEPSQATEPASSLTDPMLLVERIDLRDALAKLTEQQREIVILKFFVGLSTQEIASMIGKEPAAVYSLQARAMDTLRRYME